MNENRNPYLLAAENEEFEGMKENFQAEDENFNKINQLQAVPAVNVHLDAKDELKHHKLSDKDNEIEVNWQPVVKLTRFQQHPVPKIAQRCDLQLNLQPVVRLRRLSIDQIDKSKAKSINDDEINMQPVVQLMRLTKMDIHKIVRKMKSINKLRLIKCTEIGCKSSFETDKRLRVHMKKYHLPSAYDCIKCDQDFSTKEEYRQHKCNECDVCNLKFESSKDFRHHQLRFHKNMFQCDICSLSCNKKYEIVTHIIEKHSNVPKTISCYHCDKKFATVIRLNQHVNQLKKVQCSICDRQIARCCIKGHMNTHTGFVIKCNQCHRKFPTSSALNRHLEWHKDPTINSCKICNRNFSFSENLRRHMKIHVKDIKKKFKCDRCGIETNESGNHKRHMRKHQRDDNLLKSGLNYVRCELCCTVMQKHHLPCHMKLIHTHRKYFQCDLCGKLITSKQNIRLHFTSIHFIKLD
jgi:hypothetical protein